MHLPFGPPVSNGSLCRRGCQPLAAGALRSTAGRCWLMEWKWSHLHRPGHRGWPARVVDLRPAALRCWLRLAEQLAGIRGHRGLMGVFNGSGSCG